MELEGGAGLETMRGETADKVASRGESRYKKRGQGGWPESFSESFVEWSFRRELVLGDCLRESRCGEPCGESLVERVALWTESRRSRVVGGGEGPNPERHGPATRARAGIPNGYKYKC